MINTIRERSAGGSRTIQLVQRVLSCIYTCMYMQESGFFAERKREGFYLSAAR